MKQTLTLLLLFCATYLTAQLADFENFTLSPESFLNGSDGNGGFSSGDIFLPNNYNPDWQSWTGWAISNTTDVTTPGFMNQYSSITGEGANFSSNYAVAFISGENKMHFTNLVDGEKVSSLSITNNTYAYLSMKDGDNFTKKFGGLTGDDPDFFLLTIKAYHNGVLSTDSINFYLADYRFQDNTQDYIIDEWTEVNLEALEARDSLSFTLSSSDNGQFGMNTPAYFCIDDVDIIKLVPTTNILAEKAVDIFPNPTTDFFVLKNIQETEVLCSIYNMTGLLVYNNVVTSMHKIDLQHLVNGTYVVKIQDGDRVSSQLLIKQ